VSPRPQATAQATGWRRASRTSLYVEGTDQNAEGDLKLEFKRPDDTLIWEDIVHYTAIAADCKNQPTTTYDPLYGDSQRGFFESRFPNLRRCEWSATAGATDVYNCIAWSIGVTNQWIWYQIDAAGDGDGAVGDTLEARWHWQEFAGFELDGTWSVIPDDFPWRIHFKFKKADEAVDHQDYNNDGDEVDVLWIDDGSSTAADNTGW